MANELNFKNNLLDPYGGSKFLASRVFVNNLDDLLEAQLPANMPSAFDVEISLYSLADNSLVYNATFPNTTSGLFTIETLAYDGSIQPNNRKLLFVDFAKLQFPFGTVFGTYQIVLNFFAREIGAQNTASLYVTNVSNSGRELQLKLRPEYNTPSARQELYNFASPQISAEWVNDALKAILSQSIVPPSLIPTDKTSMSYNIVESFFSPQTNAIVDNPNVSVDTKSAIETQVKTILDRAYQIASVSANAQIQAGTSRFTRDNLILIVSSSLSSALQLTQIQGFKFT